MQLNGFHHLTAVTAEVTRNHAFYTQTLGLRLVKKSVNQDDVSAYHLFYADGKASPGTDITFFDWPVPRERRGTRSVVRTGFRVTGETALDWWAKRFGQLGVTQAPITTRDGSAVLDFEDVEGQRLSLVAEADPSGPVNPWEKSPVPPKHQITGLGAITMSVPNFEATNRVLTSVMNMRRVRDYEAGAPVHVYSMGAGGVAAELHVRAEPRLPVARPGAGGVHHVAFRTTMKDYAAWAARLDELGMPSSGPVNRFYFQSLYFREPGGVLFEIATDEPGFSADESMETLGERLALPPFLEHRRGEIEAGLKPLR